MWKTQIYNQLETDDFIASAEVAEVSVDSQNAIGTTLISRPLASALVQRLQASVDLFLRKRDESFVMKIFEKHAQLNASAGKGIIISNGVQGALGELGIKISQEEAAAIVESVGVCKGGGLDWESFREIVLKPPSKLDQWVDTLPLSGLLVSCLQVLVPDGDQLRELSKINAEQLDVAADAASQGLKQLLSDAQVHLKQMFDAMDAKALQQGSGSSSKFKTFKMSTGNVKQYFEGLVGRIGAIQIAKKWNVLKWLSSIIKFLILCLTFGRGSQSEV